MNEPLARPQGDYPQVAMIETVLGCNLRCPACYIGRGVISRRNRMMTLDEFKVISDKLRPHVNWIMMQNWGEPLLNPAIVEMVRIASTYAGVDMSTNGQLMTRELARGLIEGGISQVIISVDGATQEVYEAYRRGGTLEKAVDAIRFLLEARGGAKTPNIEFQCVVTKMNQDHLPAVRALAASLDGVTYREKLLYVHDNAMANELLPDKEEYQRFDPRRDSATRLKPCTCTAPMDCATILVDGSVVPCCYDYDGKVTFGNLLADDLETVWHGEAIQAFRRKLAAGEMDPFCVPICGRTSLPVSQPAPVSPPHFLQSAKSVVRSFARRLRGMEP